MYMYVTDTDVRNHVIVDIIRTTILTYSPLTYVREIPIATFVVPFIY